MDDNTAQQTKAMRITASEVRGDLREKYENLPYDIKLLYSSRQCQMCTAHLTIRQLNRVIHDGVPPVCLACYKKMQGRIQELAPLFNQLNLL